MDTAQDVTVFEVSADPLTTKSPTDFRQAGFESFRRTVLYLSGTKPTCRAIFWPSSLTVKSMNAFTSPVGSPLV